MQAIRKRIKAKNGLVSIPIPEKMRGAELDVIIIPVEGEEQTKPIDPVQYRGALKVDLSNDDIDKDISKGRDQWNGRIS